MSDGSDLRVLFVSPPLEASGGIGRVSGYELAELRKDPTIHVTYRDSRGRGSVSRSFARALGVALHVLARRKRYDLVHLNTSTRASTLRKGLVGRAARLAGLPYVVHLHGSGYDTFYAAQPAGLRRWIRSFFRHASRVVVLGEHWRHFAIETLGVPAGRVSVVPNTAPGPSSVAPRDASGPLRAAFLGRLDDRKGVHLVLEALATLRREGVDVPIVVAGDGDDTRLRGIAADGSLHADFLGWVDEAQVHEVLAGTDVLVLPSAAENQPISVIEAMAHGVVPVVTPVGAVTDLVEDGVSGLILPERSSDAIAACLRRLDDRALLATLAAGAREHWEHHLTPGHHVGLLVAAWRSAADRGGTP